MTTSNSRSIRLMLSRIDISQISRGQISIWWLIVAFSSLSMAQAQHPLPPSYPNSRQAVDSSQLPWRAIGLLNRAGLGHCTATLIGPKVAISAAHCIWNKRTNDWFPLQYLHFVAGFDRGKFQSSSKVKAVDTDPRYREARANGSAELARDWAIVHLEEPVGDQVGYLRFRAIDRIGIEQQIDTGARFAAAGYRADRKFVLTVDQDCKPSAVKLSSDAPGALLAHRCAITFGDSGGPILRRARNAARVEYELVAIHVAVAMRNGQRTGLALATSAFAQRLPTNLFPGQRTTTSHEKRSKH